MKLALAASALALLAVSARASAPASFHDFTLADVDGKPQPLAAYKGLAVLVVNTASECGYTPQYAGLQELYTTYKDRGFTVLAFPANDFFGQEPGTNAQIKQFCATKYGVTFPVFSKIHVKGKEMDPLYRWLTTQEGFAGDVSWNFNKILVSPDGKVVARFGSGVKPMSAELRAKVEAALPKR